MLDKIFRVIFRLLLSVLLLGMVIYFAVALYYQNVFMVNTWINGVYCTGKTVEEVNAELLLLTEAPSLTITGLDGETLTVDVSQAGYQVDYKKSLQVCLKSQKVLQWPSNIMVQKNIDVLPAVTWDKETLIELVKEASLVKKAVADNVDVQIVRSSNGYELYDGMQNVFDVQAFAELVNHNLEMGIYHTDIAKSDCYHDVADNKEQASTRKLWEKLERFITCDIVYDMGAEQIRLDKATVSEFVLVGEHGEFVLDENGDFMLNDEALVAFVENLVKQYNTCDTDLAFLSTRGDIINVPYVTYGTELDLEAEIAYLKEAFLNKVSEVHEPVYIQEGYVRGKNDIGDTYIEVDMTMQKLYCYKQGQLIVETDIVTGNMKRKWSTPVGVNYVYAKQKDRILRGETYASPVDYWMPVKGNIGIHDADWRNKFGGEIYLTNGSHGCINVPPEVMPTVYEEFEVGTPVIMFY